MNYIALIGIISAALLGCGGKPRTVADQPENKLMLPEYRPGSGGTFLTDGEIQRFDGSILIWNDIASPEQIMAISKLSDETKLAQGKAVAFYSEHGPNIVKIADLGAQRITVEKEGQDDLARRRAENDRRQRSELLNNSHLWFPAKLDTFVAAGILTPEEQQVALSKFASYCEAKLWEMASSSYLMSFNYASRPTPDPICEFVYEQKGLLSQEAAVCQDPIQPGQSKDFFACIWFEGVFKTDFWLKKYSDPTQAATVGALLHFVQEGGWKESILAAPHPEILDEGKFIFQGQELKASPIEYPHLGKKKLAKWLRNYERDTAISERASINPELWLFSNPTDNAEFANVRRLISILGKRDDSTYQPVAALDLIYNGSIANNSLTPRDGDAKSLAYRNAGLTDFPNLFGKPDSALNDIAPDFIKKIAQMDQTVADLQQSNEGWAAYDSELGRLTDDSLNAAVSPNAVLELWSAAISVERIGGVYKVVVGFSQLTDSNKGTIFGCADIESGASVACPEAAPGLESAAVTFNVESGRFSVKANIIAGEKLATDMDPDSDKTAAGAKSDRTIGLLDYSILGGRAFEMTLDPTVVEGLKYYTGSLKISAASHDDISGSVNFSSYGSTIDSFVKKYGPL